MLLIGTYCCKIDVKGRLMLPVSLRKQLKSIWGDGFIIKRSVFQKCLELYPKSEWNAVMKKVNALNRFVKKNNDFIRRLSAGLKEVEADGQGRVQISKDLIGFGSLEKEVTLSFSVNMIEIWNTNDYERVIEKTEEDFAELAEEVMGNKENDAYLS
ncbi:division/cell wall cluster transcriptional repressor MraZ [Bacteroidetes bacterium endosymbiont of Geopemphigus sp.]|uniref:division/cell wall cluster transcriptional repressor MraZ n=1 Tax=Bacteroidetes bacterium endosymbiont of Geopemphigus sp. TaxID=2047937 RepID=UPI000CD11491|nr:division/cell wall cluster transcriptional repressor MraZ [Bacteroidetes bacterium endosymbiont of Geopemphigus sp.]